MISVNDVTVNVKQFPAGEQSITDFVYADRHDNRCVIKWNYENDGELFTLISVVGHLRNKFQYYFNNLILVLPYMPHARMDRTKANSEVFTLKYFAKVINDLNFTRVAILDAHSDVSVGLLDRVVNSQCEEILRKVLRDINDNKIVVYFPDAGAYKRYKDNEAFNKLDMIYGEKIRDWKTHRIMGLTVNKNGLTDEQLAGRNVIMIDDIISYGGTFYHSAKALADLNVQQIYAYATHTENEMLNEERGTFIKALNSGLVKRLYTTDSIFNKEHEKVTVINAF